MSLLRVHDVDEFFLKPSTLDALVSSFSQALICASSFGFVTATSRVLELLNHVIVLGNIFGRTMAVIHENLVTFTIYIFSPNCEIRMA